MPRQKKNPEMEEKTTNQVVYESGLTPDQYEQAKKLAAAAEVENPPAAVETVPEYSIPVETPEAPFEGPIGDRGPEGTPGVAQKNDADELEALRQRVAELEAAARQRPSTANGVVELTFLASVSPNNVCYLGDYGSLNGVGGYIEIPRKEFGGKFMTPVVRSLLRDRSLIVCSGLSEEERKRYGVDYREGELLDMSAFDRLLDMPLAELTRLFSKLCPEHKEFAATRFITAYEKGDNRVSREKIEPLNDISKDINPKGMFRPILDGMNKA